MRKTILSILLAALVILTLAASVSAIGEEMTVAKGTPTVDGAIDDIWASAQRVQLGYCKAGDLKQSASILPDTCAAYGSVLYDDTALYFLFEIEDDDFSFASTAGDWKNDSIYLYIDEEETLEATWNDSQCQIALIPEDGLEMIPRNGQAPADYSLAYSFPTETTCVIEFRYVPRTLALKDGVEFTLDFQYNDGTPGATRDYCLGWSDDNDGASGNSGIWGYATLGASGESASEADAPASAGFASAADAAAAVGMTPITGYEWEDGSNGFGGEGPENLWDGETSTKFCTNEFPAESVASLDGTYKVTGFAMATANDNADYNGRSPNAWTVYVSSDGESWSELASGDDSFFEETNFTYYNGNGSAEGVAFVKFTAEGTSSGTFQVSELTLYGEKTGDKPAKAEEPKAEEPAEDAPAEAVENVTEAVGEAAEAVGGAVEDAVNAVQNAADEAAAKAKSGCGSMIGGGFAVLLVILGSAWIAKRK